MHSQNVIHGDIKLENIITVRQDHLKMYIKIIDFGFSQCIEPEGRIEVSIL